MNLAINSYLAPLPRRHYVMIDVMKLVMAFAVVLLHAMSFGRYLLHPSLEWLSKLAVPFFFFASCFFVGLKLRDADGSGEKSRLLVKRALAVGRVWIIWNLVSLAYFLICYCGYYDSAFDELPIFIKCFVIRGNNTVSWQLWFLCAMALNFILIAAIIKTKQAKRLLIAYFCIALAVLLLATAFSSSNHLCNLIIECGYFNYFPIIFIIPGLALGYYGVPRHKVAVAIVLLVLSALVFSYCEMLSRLFGGMALFLLCLRPVRIVSPERARTMRSLSMYIYLTHMIVIYAITALLQYTPTMWKLAVAAYIASGAIGELIRRGAATQRLAFLRHLAA